MKVVDIVNRENQSLERCDQEPIHIPGSIQPHGMLIAVEAAVPHNVKYCSANTPDIFKRNIADILGRPLSEIFHEDDCSRLSQYLERELFDTTFSCGVNGIDFAISAHRVNDLFILEFEQLPDGSLSVFDQFNQTKRFLNTIQHAENFQQICQSIAHETRNIIGYDRVMVYRFDKDYNGEVFAESKRDDLPSYLGHHYPHTDIPAQARELYLKNLLRIIVDVNYTPVPILTLDDPNVGNKTLDMSMCMLRSVSPIHVEYLQNMGVAATVTISLIENKKLWGLIACHNYSPQHVPFYTRLAAQLQGHFLTSQISVRESAEENELTSKLDEHLETLLKDIEHTNQFLQQPDLLHRISGVPNATGVAMIRKGDVLLSGVTPSEEQIRELLPWLKQQSADGIYTTSKLSQHFAQALDYGEAAAGLLYHNVGNSDKDGIIWFRSEMDKTINWGGRPSDTLRSDGTSAMLTPRKSFELWQERVKNQSTEWLAPERNVAAKFAHILQRQFYAMHLEEEEKRYVKLNENLKKANAELANINWIGTHDLKEPLRKIQIFASRILQAEGEASPRTIDSVMRMKQSATRMQALVGDLLKYSKLNQDGHSEFSEPVNLNQIIAEVLKQFEDDIEEKKVSVSVATLPIINGVHFQLTQLFVNLIDNSLKFTREEGPAAIDIHAEQLKIEDTTYHKVSIADLGIGFSDEYKEKIFEVFQRLHNNQFPGTGIGLAICKKVMENHNGLIRALSNTHTGATFELYFPA